MFAVSIPGTSRAAPAFLGKLGCAFPSRIPEFLGCSFPAPPGHHSILVPAWIVNGRGNSCFSWDLVLPLDPLSLFQRNWILLQRFPGAGIPVLCCSLWDSVFSIPNDKLRKKGILLWEFPDFYGFSSLIPKSFQIPKISPKNPNPRGFWGCLLSWFSREAEA